MKKLNLKELKIYKDLSKIDFVVCDGTKEVANFIYNNSGGLANHALALKLYNSDGVVEINEEEEELLMESVNRLKPSVIDAINLKLNEPE